MREGQINSLQQAEELLESAKTNPLHLELAKYLIKNMNSVGVAQKKGWLWGCDEHDEEYADKYVQLRDKYGEILFPGCRVDESQWDDFIGEYNPPMGTAQEVIAALNSGYDFKTETGTIIFTMINATWSRAPKMLNATKHAKQIAEAQEVVDALNSINESQ